MTDLIYKRDKTRQDVDELLMQHKNLVYYRLTQMGQLANQDAESAAWEALWDAIETFDVFGKTAFSTYACACITNAINDVLRKQMTEKSHIEFVELDEANIIFTQDEYRNPEVMRVLDEVFAWHMENSTDIAKSVLQLWRAGGFTDSATMIAKACGTSASYVSRVQCSFRARLGGKLKGVL